MCRNTSQIKSPLLKSKSQTFLLVLNNTLFLEHSCSVSSLLNTEKLLLKFHCQIQQTECCCPMFSMAVEVIFDVREHYIRSYHTQSTTAMNFWLLMNPILHVCYWSWTVISVAQCSQIFQHCCQLLRMAFCNNSTIMYSVGNLCKWHKFYVPPSTEHPKEFGCILRWSTIRLGHKSQHRNSVYFKLAVFFRYSDVWGSI